MAFRQTIARWSPTAHHDVRMKDFFGIFIVGTEHNGPVAQRFAKLLQYVRIRARRQIGISNPVGVVIGDAAGALEETPISFVAGEIDDSGYGESVGFQHVNHVSPALRAPIRRPQRVQNNRSVIVR